jgi:hypothetical protein
VAAVLAAFSAKMLYSNYPRKSDFLNLVTAARYGPEMYGPEAIAELSPDYRIYTQPPFVAVFVWPLSRLPYWLAYCVWACLMFGCSLAFARLWGERYEALLFVPLITALGLGQNVPAILLAIALSVRLAERSPLAAGCLLSLAAAKPHLVAFVPLVLLAQKRYRMLAGLCGGGVALYLISAAVVGWDWPVAQWGAILEMQRVLKEPVGNRWGSVEMAAMVAGPCLVWWFARRRDLRWAVAYALAASVFVAPRVMMYDLALLLPLASLLGIEAALVGGVALSLHVTPAALISWGTLLLAVVWPPAVEIYRRVRPLRRSTAEH